jgi:hypothetical protein
MAGNSPSNSNRGDVHQTARLFERRQAQDLERQAAMVRLSGNPQTQFGSADRPGWRSK